MIEGTEDFLVIRHPQLVNCKLCFRSGTVTTRKPLVEIDSCRLLIFPCVVAVCAPGFVYADDNPEGKKETVSFNGHTLVLAFEGENPSETVKEFLPTGQRLDSWKQLASIRKYPKLDNPKLVAENLVRVLKQQNPEAPHQLTQDPKTGAVVVDFVTWPRNQAFVEFNVFKYMKTDGGGLVAHQYALRNYDEQEKFLRQLKPLRARLVKLMTEKGLAIEK